MNTGIKKKKTMATQLTPRKEKRNIKRYSSTRTQTDPALTRNLPSKRKVTSPLEEKRIVRRKKPKQGELTYAEACINSDGVRKNNRKDRIQETDNERITVNKQRRISSAPDRTAQLNSPKSGEITKWKSRKRLQTCRRNEAILVKVEVGKNWIEAYRNIVGAKTAI